MNSPTEWRLGIDGDALRRPMSGVGNYVLELARALEARWPEAGLYLYTRLAPDELVLPSARWVVRREPVPVWRRLPSFLWLKTRGARMIRRDRIDVFWAGRTIGPGEGVAGRTVCTVHDLNLRLVPETMERATYWSHRLWFDDSIRRASLVVANSHGTAARVRQWVGRAADAVVPPGVRDAYRPPSGDPGEVQTERDVLARAHGIQGPYLLFVGTLEPRKNVRLLLEAFRRMLEQGTAGGCRLVIVGARGWRNSDLQDLIAAVPADSLCLPGYVPDEHMPMLYRCAQALVAPSLYEGFGMPVLEARACGTPVVVSDVPELREAGGPDAVVLRELTPAAVCEALAAVLTEPPRADLAVRPSDISWEARARVFAGLLSPGDAATGTSQSA